jgi:hypothetical protein
MSICLIMPNVLYWCSLIVIVIGDYTPTAGKTDDTDASVLSAVNDLYSPVLPLMMLPLFLSPQEWIWVVLNLNLPK